MPGSNPDDSLLLIRCPSCGQRFKVGEDLRGRTVECGGCEQRFRINDDVIVRGRKFYPGERKNARLNRFQRVPLAVSPPVMGMAPVYYADAPDPVKFEPASPQRIVAGFFGGIAIVLMALLLILGAKSGGALDGITTENRMIMACFTGLLATLLLAYANPRGRGKAIALGLVSSIGLAILPFAFTDGSIPLPSNEVTQSTPADDFRNALDAPAESGEIAELRRKIGTDPLASEIQRLASEGSTRQAVGLWLRDLREHNRFLVKDYILRASGAAPESHYYPRGDGDFLMVVTGINQSLDEMAAIAAALGTVERTYPEIAVIEVRVNNQNFIEGPIEKLNDRNHPAFYDLNKRELESIDLARVERAVKRLGEAEPKVYRSDITRKLLSLLAMPEVTFKGPVCSALAVWSEESGPAGEAALTEASRLMAHGATIPEEMISLIVKAENPGVIPILDELWANNPNRWEALYGDVGQAAEATLLKRFPETTGSFRQAAVRVLGRVGGTASLPVLENAKTGADAELSVLLDRAIQAILARLGR
ncbi:MAG: hypothetical protein EHM17_02365 [Verrucomicrobiaceae bacterium]|nr:MAG: hypothetical protein EHM17_02365 [Verrucomicrobiaceae bacterium]